MFEVGGRHVGGMGKMKRCSRGRKARCRPTGLSSLLETEKGVGESIPKVTIPLLEKLSSTEVAEREWACRSVAHLLCETDAQQTLLNHQGLPRSLTALLLDPEWSVREAAAGALRNLSSVGGDSVCQTLVRDDVMTALSALLRQCMSQVQRYPVAAVKVPDSLPTPPSPVPPPHSQPHSPHSLPLPLPTLPIGQGKGKGKARNNVTLHHVLATIEQSLHLLLNIGEGCSAVVGLANREELVPVLLYFLQPSVFFPDILTTAAMCLYTVTEDNPPSHHLLTSTPSHLAHLETLLAPPPPLTDLLDQRHWIILSTLSAGVFQHLLPSLPTPPPSPLISSVFSVLTSVLDTDVSSLLTTLTSTPPHTPPQGECEVEHSVEGCLDSVLSEAESVLTAQLLALEITANLCYTESDEGEWEDVEEEEVIGGDLPETDEGPMELEAHHQAPEWLSGVLVETGMVGRVWRKCVSPLVSPLPPRSLLHHCQTHVAYKYVVAKTMLHMWREVQMRGMAALQNMLSALPPSATPPDSTLAMWRGVLEMVGSSGGVAMCEEVTGLLAVLVEKMGEQNMQCVSVDQLEVLSAASRERLATNQYQQVVDIILTMRCVGKHSLHFPTSIKTPILEVVGRTLRECMSGGGSVWVVARALDTLYDVFGADECPPHLFSDLQIMPILKTIAAQLPKRGSGVSRTELGTAVYGEVVCARDNLLPFIDYMTTRTCPNL
ncbi:HEAT repeat-containing protein 3 [Geodia barretti]|uniref:HEAT repeat-containing protein 3 n=2 Tax=Geodia barretti TaxID=519541 RepID=A0AA35W7L4_GEOBA|nr:HEAT repeat-containing protein 3 [Geodia barretti]